jgi:hypothetical protein
MAAIALRFRVANAPLLFMYVVLYTCLDWFRAFPGRGPATAAPSVPAVPHRPDGAPATASFPGRRRLAQATEAAHLAAPVLRCI